MALQHFFLLQSLKKIQSAHLVRHGQLWEIRDVPGPLHGAEEQPRSQFTYVIDPHGVLGPRLLVVLVSVATAGIRLGSQQLRDELRHRLASAAAPVVVEFAAVAGGAAQGRDGGTEAGLRWDATALDCCSVVGRQRGAGGEGRGTDGVGGTEMIHDETKAVRR